ncbi:MAG TPA: hypothetical protein VLJ21_01205 [Candidatus Binatia bacterium]|nr:hypothetical protein [Candidatus Binatia bacterium]
MKYWALALIALLLLAACDVPPAPHGETSKPPKPAPHPTAPTPTPVAQPINTAPPNATELGIQSQVGTLSFKSPELKEGQWVQYKITTGDITYDRSYSILTFYHNSDPCIGIERNSTKPGELRTQTMWCDDTKYLFAWNTKYNQFSEPQNLGRQFWSDESIQGFETKTSGLYNITTSAGLFWTLKRESYDGMTRKAWYASPLVPGFEAGLVKEVDVTNGVTTTTELVAYHE